VFPFEASLIRRHANRHRFACFLSSRLPRLQRISPGRLVPLWVKYSRHELGFLRSSRSSSPRLNSVVTHYCHPLVPLVARSECSFEPTCSLRRPPKRHGRKPSLPWGFVTFRRLQKRAATCIGLASSDFAAPAGFLNLLTRSSTRNLSALFRADNALRFCTTFRGFPLPIAVLLSRKETAPHAVAKRPNDILEDMFAHLTIDSAPGIDALERSVHVESVLPGVQRPCLSWPSPLRGFHSSSLDSMLPSNLLSWALS
jgi:hypothetical protein